MNKTDTTIMHLIKDLSRKKKASCIIRNKPFYGLVFSEIINALKTDVNREDRRAVQFEINRLIESCELKFIRAEPALFLVLPEDYSVIIDEMMKSTSS